MNFLIENKKTLWAISLAVFLGAFVFIGWVTYSQQKQIISLQNQVKEQNAFRENCLSILKEMDERTDDISKHVPKTVVGKPGSVAYRLSHDATSADDLHSQTIKRKINEQEIPNNSSKNTMQLQEEEYVGNARTKVLHRLGCSYVDRMSEENKEYYNILDEAYDDGYRNCLKCF